MSLISEAECAWCKKFQTPTSKLQRSSKIQAPKWQWDAHSLNDGHRGGAHAEQLWRRVFDFDAHREPLGDMHPVQLAPHVRQTVRNINLVGRLDRPADAMHFSGKMAIGRGGQIDFDGGAGREMPDFALPEICHDIPLAGVQ